MDMESLQYPIGKFTPTPFSETALEAALLEIEQLPENLENAILNLDEAQLHTPYREGAGRFISWCIILQTVT